MSETVSTSGTGDPAAVARAQQALAEEHRRLHELVDRLRGAADLPSLAAAVDELSKALAAHFQHEEYPGGLYDSLGACVPRHHERLSALVDEHYKLLAEVRQLADNTRAALDRPFRDLQDRAQQLTQLLAGHETREHELVRAVTGA